jgi:hypothetical protein
MAVKKIDYKAFIERYFMVIDAETQVPVPFRLNAVQNKYLNMLNEKHPDQEGIRDIILKARQQGFSTFILALFTVDFLVRDYSVSICISHRKDSTELLFKKVKFFIDSYLEKLVRIKGKENDWDEMTILKQLEKEKKAFLTTDSKSMLENATNNAMFYIGTAGTKVGGRGGSCRNIHFSEAAFYNDTELITAEEIIVGTAQQVQQGKGMIFIESTANGEGNYYYDEWQRAHDFDRDGNPKSAYRPVFFGWQEFYTEAWVMEKRKSFSNDKMWKQEYPGNPDEAFITSGSPYFDLEILDRMIKQNCIPIEYGKLAMDGNFI